MTLISQTQRLGGCTRGAARRLAPPRARCERRVRVFPVLPALAVGLSVLASAQPALAEFEAGVFAGYYAFSEKNRLGRYDLDPPATAFSAAPTFGARFAYVPARYFATEIQLSIVPTSTRDGRASVLVVHGRGHLVGALPLGRLRPFVLLGLGAVNATPADPVYLRNLTQLNFHAGVGSRYDFGKWGVRLDVQAAAVPRVDKPGIAFEPAILLGLYGNFPWPPTPPPPFDQDRDDITDDKDECPEDAGEIRFGGCPDPSEGSEEEESEGEEEEEKEAGDASESGAPPSTTPTPATTPTPNATPTPVPTQPSAPAPPRNSGASPPSGKAP